MLARLPFESFGLDDLLDLFEGKAQSLGCLDELDNVSRFRRIESVAGGRPRSDRNEAFFFVVSDRPGIDLALFCQLTNKQP